MAMSTYKDEEGKTWGLTCTRSSSFSSALLAEVASFSSCLACTRAPSSCWTSLYSETGGLKNIGTHSEDGRDLSVPVVESR